MSEPFEAKLRVDRATVSRTIGAPQVAGTVVYSTQDVKRQVTRVAGGQLLGVAGYMAGDRLAARKAAGPSKLPAFASAYLALSDDELVLLEIRRGALHAKGTGKVLTRVPRSNVSSADITETRSRYVLTLNLEDGATWRFNVPTRAKPEVDEVVRALA